MNCFIATEGLPGAPEHFPTKLPTHRLHIPDLAAIALVSGFARSSTAFLVTQEALRLVEKAPEYQACDGLFFVLVHGQRPRFDLIKGNWVQRDPGTPEYESAMCEDAIILDRVDESNKQALRFRRVVEINDLEFSES